VKKPRNRLTPVGLRNVLVKDSFFTPRMETNRTITLAAEYSQLSRVGTLKSYQWDWWDRKNGNPPWRPWLGDLGKWIEACAYAIMGNPDPQLENRVEEVIAEVARGQKEDGYIYGNPLPREWRWANLAEWHEMYDLGHLIEAAVAWHQATGHDQLLEVVCRAADLVEDNFGWEHGKKRGYDGHEEIELALIKLFRETGQSRYLKLAKFFVDIRGTTPNYFVQELKDSALSGLPSRNWLKDDLTLFQAHQPVREQEDAVGHSVRALYFYSGVADVAAETGDDELLETCQRLWKSVTRRRMYVIGGVGSTAQGEAFTFDYDLPNETAYAETCANIALAFFAHRMLQLYADAEYADVLERALYNGILSGVSLDGKKFFYANHLTVYPRAIASAHGHVAATRQEWFGCACCPPNIARLIASVGQYIYSTSEETVYVHLYIGSSTECRVGGQEIKVRQNTEYPWKEKILITVQPTTPARFTVGLRMPGWCRGARIRVNNKPVKYSTLKGYALLRRTWYQNDRIELTLPMPIQRLEAHPAARMDCGKISLQRGPVVYCLEQVDNGKNLADISLSRRSVLSAKWDQTLCAMVLVGTAYRREEGGWKGALYRPIRSKPKSVRMKAVPYCLWNNRGDGEMLVWINYR
jgi:uncharacterized protein